MVVLVRYVCGAANVVVMTLNNCRAYYNFCDTNCMDGDSESNCNSCIICDANHNSAIRGAATGLFATGPIYYV